MFTEPNGKISNVYSLEWEYKNPDIYKKGESIQAFSGQSKAPCAFQISCKG
jgi:hypothetical protein